MSFESKSTSGKTPNVLIEIRDRIKDVLDQLLGSGESDSTVNVTDRPARDLGKVDIAGIDTVGGVAGQADMAGSIPVAIASDQSGYRGKGSVTTAHNAITETTTSVEINHQGYNGTILSLEGSLENGQTWVVEILGAAVSGGTFGKSYYQDFEQKITITYDDLSTDGVVNFTCPGVQNYIKIRATLSGGTAELTVRVTPVNL